MSTPLIGTLSSYRKDVIYVEVENSDTDSETSHSLVRLFHSGITGETHGFAPSLKSTEKEKQKAFLY